MPRKRVTGRKRENLRQIPPPFNTSFTPLSNQRTLFKLVTLIDYMLVFNCMVKNIFNFFRISTYTKVDDSLNDVEKEQQNKYAFI